jgi:hypothetical protein
MCATCGPMSPGIGLSGDNRARRPVTQHRVRCRLSAPINALSRTAERMGTAYACARGIAGMLATVAKRRAEPASASSCWRVSRAALLMIARFTLQRQNPAFGVRRGQTLCRCTPAMRGHPTVDANDLGPARAPSLLRDHGAGKGKQLRSDYAERLRMPVEPGHDNRPTSAWPRGATPGGDGTKKRTLE